MRLPLFLLLLSALALPRSPAVAEQNPVGRDDGIFTIAVLGDSLAAGVWIGLARKLQHDRRFELVRHTEAATGLARPDRYNWEQELGRFLERHQVDALVFSVGLNDLQSMYSKGKRRYLFRSADWDRTYAKRIDRLMSRFRDTGIPTFWIGLPIMRSSAFTGGLRHMNTLFRLQAEHFGIHYVSLWEISVDENGEYSSYLPDNQGRRRLMRANDGAHFTPTGYEMIGEHVLKVMRRELDVFASDKL